MQIPTFAEALGALNLGSANPFADAPAARVASFGCDPRNELLERLAAARPRAPPLARAMLAETFAPLGAARIIVESVGFVFVCLNFRII